MPVRSPLLRPIPTTLLYPRVAHADHSPARPPTALATHRAVMTPRPHGARVQLWVRDKSAIERVNALGRRLVKLLDLAAEPGVALEFVPHGSGAGASAGKHYLSLNNPGPSVRTGSGGEPESATTAGAAATKAAQGRPATSSTGAAGAGGWRDRTSVGVAGGVGAGVGVGAGAARPAGRLPVVGRSASSSST